MKSSSGYSTARPAFGILAKLPRLGGSLIVFWLAAAWSCNADDAVRYSIRDLGDLGGGYGRSWSINDYGQVVGDALLPIWPPIDRAVTWTAPGTITDLGTLGGWSSAAWDINNSGTICGWAEDPSRNVLPALWTGGVASALTLGGGISGYARAINDYGVAVGNTIWSSGDHAVLWEGGSVRDLGTLGGCSSVAYDINNHGTVVGQSYDSDNHTRATMWEGNDDPVDLGGLSGGQWTQVNQINDLGGMILQGKPQDVAYYHAAYWDGSSSSVDDLGTLGGLTSWAYGLNDKGFVVGAADLTIGYHAFVWDGEDMTDLGTLGGYFSIAYDINEDGVIVGIANDAHNTYHAVEWVPRADSQPSPVPDRGSSLPLLCVSLCSVWVCFQWKRLTTHGT